MATERAKAQQAQVRARVRPWPRGPAAVDTPLCGPWPCVCVRVREGGWGGNLRAGAGAAGAVYPGHHVLRRAQARRGLLRVRPAPARAARARRRRTPAPRSPGRRRRTRRTDGRGGVGFEAPLWGWRRPRVIDRAPGRAGSPGRAAATARAAGSRPATPWRSAPAPHTVPPTLPRSLPLSRTSSLSLSRSLFFSLSIPLSLSLISRRFPLAIADRSPCGRSHPTPRFAVSSLSAAPVHVRVPSCRTHSLRTRHRDKPAGRERSPARPARQRGGFLGRGGAAGP